MSDGRKDKDLFALVRQPDIAPPTRHYEGLPAKLADGENNQHSFPSPKVLLIDHREDGVFLTRYAESGAFAGDTWHPTVDDAKAQARAEYGNAVQSWMELPGEIGDPHEYVRVQILDGSEPSE